MFYKRELKTWIYNLYAIIVCMVLLSLFMIDIVTFIAVCVLWILLNRCFKINVFQINFIKMYIEHSNFLL